MQSEEVHSDSSTGDEIEMDQSYYEKLSETELHELFLYNCRNGQLDKVKSMYELCRDINLDISCKGTSKCNLGWTPLHLASYFGHITVVEFLLIHGAEINAVNDAGDTPLHKAAFIGREDIVCLLLSRNADVNILNGEGRAAHDVCKDNDGAKNMIMAAEITEAIQKEKKLLQAARSNDLDNLNSLLKENKPPNINCVDLQGNSALHCAAYRGHKEAAVLLLQNGISTNMKNARGQTALDLAKDEQMRQVLSVQPIKHLVKTVQRFEGRLFRKSKFIGWKSHWAVLERGVLEYFKNKSDARLGLKRKEFKYLDSAKVMVSNFSPASFNIYFSDGTVHGLSVPLDAIKDVTGEITRQKWVTALKEHIEFTRHYLNHKVRYDSDDDDDDLHMKPLGSMLDSLKTASAHHQIVDTKLKEAQAALGNIKSDTSNNSDKPCDIIKAFENISSSANSMLSSLTHCLRLIEQQEEVRVLQLKQEQEKCRVLEEALNVLAQEHHELEQSIATHMSRSISLVSVGNPKYMSDDDTFFDAYDAELSDSDTLISSPNCNNSDEEDEDSDTIHAAPLSRSNSCSTITSYHSFQSTKSHNSNRTMHSWRSDKSHRSRSSQSFQSAVGCKHHHR